MPWDPTTPGNLFALWRGDQNINTGPPAVWTDTTANAIALNGPGSGNDPVWNATALGASFPGWVFTHNQFTMATGNLNFQTPFTILSVGNIQTLDGNNSVNDFPNYIRVNASGTPGLAPDLYLYYYTGNPLGTGNTINAKPPETLGSGAIANNALFSLAFTYSGTITECFLNFASIGQSSYSTTLGSAASPLQLNFSGGGGSSGNGFSCKYGIIALYKQALNASDMNQWAGWVNTNFGTSFPFTPAATATLMPAPLIFM